MPTKVKPFEEFLKDYNKALFAWADSIGIFPEEAAPVRAYNKIHYFIYSFFYLITTWLMLVPSAILKGFFDGVRDSFRD